MTRSVDFGDRKKNIGVVDAEYIVHYGLPTLGEPHQDEKVEIATRRHVSQGQKESPRGKVIGQRFEVRRESYKRWWKRAAVGDECW